MGGITVSQLIPVLQVAVGPVVLISGIGLLILSMTNRLGRVIDRGRSLFRELPQTAEADQQRLTAQITILTRRAVLLQRAITLATASVLCAAVLIIVLFLTAALRIEVAALIGVLFTAAMGALIFSLVAFLQELNLSLVAFRMDLGEYSGKKPD
jgi:hypothetical protein